MKKKMILPTLAIVLSFGIGSTCIAANGTDIISSMKSQNTLKYQGANGEVAIYGSDIMLLARKLATIPVRPFNPDIYTHIHAWEYIDITDSTHTKHCPECGSENDLINPHIAAQKDECEITYDEETYTVNNCTCECGYQWKEEESHHLVYKSISDSKHSVSCGLAGTDYCSGYRSYNEEHTYYEEPDADGTHHTVKCSLCDYEKQAECDFTYNSELNEDETEITWFCQCGNSKTEAYTADPGSTTLFSIRPYSIEADLNSTAVTNGAQSNELNANTENANTENANTENANTENANTENANTENANTENDDIENKSQDDVTDTSQTASLASYISNHDGTHRVQSDAEIIMASEPCTLEAEPDTYDTLTGKAVYSCKLCGYSTEDEYIPETGKDETAGENTTPPEGE